MGTSFSHCCQWGGSWWIYSQRGTTNTLSLCRLLLSRRYGFLSRVKSDFFLGRSSSCLACTIFFNSAAFYNTEIIKQLTRSSHNIIVPKLHYTANDSAINYCIATQSSCIHAYRQTLSPKLLKSKFLNPNCCSLYYYGYSVFNNATEPMTLKEYK